MVWSGNTQKGMQIRTAKIGIDQYNPFPQSSQTITDAADQETLSRAALSPTDRPDLGGWGGLSASLTFHFAPSG